MGEESNPPKNSKMYLANFFPFNSPDIVILMLLRGLMAYIQHHMFRFLFPLNEKKIFGVVVIKKKSR